MYSINTIVFINVKFQRERFKALEDHVANLFERREFFKEVSDSIVSFLHASSNTNCKDHISDMPDVPFNETSKEIQQILKKEFKKD